MIPCLSVKLTITYGILMAGSGVAAFALMPMIPGPWPFFVVACLLRIVSGIGCALVQNAYMTLILTKYPARITSIFVRLSSYRDMSLYEIIFFSH